MIRTRERRYLFSWPPFRVAIEESYEHEEPWDVGGGIRLQWHETRWRFVRWKIKD